MATALGARPASSRSRFATCSLDSTGGPASAPSSTAPSARRSSSVESIAPLVGIAAEAAGSAPVLRPGCQRPWGQRRDRRTPPRRPNPGEGRRGRCRARARPRAHRRAHRPATSTSSSSRGPARPRTWPPARRKRRSRRAPCRCRTGRRECADDRSITAPASAANRASHPGSGVTTSTRSSSQVSRACHVVASGVHVTTPRGGTAIR